MLTPTEIYVLWNLVISVVLCGVTLHRLHSSTGVSGNYNEYFRRVALAVSLGPLQYPLAVYYEQPEVAFVFSSLLQGIPMFLGMFGVARLQNRLIYMALGKQIPSAIQRVESVLFKVFLFFFPVLMASGIMFRTRFYRAITMLFGAFSGVVISTLLGWSCIYWVKARHTLDKCTHRIPGLIKMRRTGLLLTLCSMLWLYSRYTTFVQHMEAGNDDYFEYLQGCRVEFRCLFRPFLAMLCTLLFTYLGWGSTQTRQIPDHGMRRLRQEDMKTGLSLFGKTLSSLSNPLDMAPSPTLIETPMNSVRLELVQIETPMNSVASLELVQSQTKANSCSQPSVNI